MNLEGAIKNVIRDVPDFPKPGIMFKDITPIFYDQQLCNLIVDGFITGLSEKPDAVIGIESRGFFFGFVVANRLHVLFILVRKQGKFPSLKRSGEYELEYGTATIEIHEDAIRTGWNVLIHDDLLATGGTAEAAARLVKEAGAQISGFNFVIGLDFLEGKNKLIKHTKNITCLAHY